MNLPTVYVINLDRDVDRLKSISLNLKNVGLPFKRLPAVLGKEIKDWKPYVDLKLYSQRNSREAPTAGEIGCYLSHLKAMETFLETEDPWCVILEDDAEVQPECIQVLQKLSGKNDWDLVKLYNYHSGMPIKVRQLGNAHSLVIHLTRTTSTAGYAINRVAAGKLLKVLLPFTELIDHAIDRPWETDLRIRGIRPFPVLLAPSSRISTIDYKSRKPKKLFGFKRIVLFFVRAKKNFRDFQIQFLLHLKPYPSSFWYSYTEQ